MADALLAGSRPGDVVAFCPDQLEPSVHRELGRNLTEVTFPAGSPPGRVNWTNYLSRVRASDPDLFARQLLTPRRPVAHRLGGVGERYRGLGRNCEGVLRELEASGRRGTVVVKGSARYFERQTLVRFAGS